MIYAAQNRVKLYHFNETECEGGSVTLRTIWNQLAAVELKFNRFGALHARTKGVEV